MGTIQPTTIIKQTEKKTHTHTFHLNLCKFHPFTLKSLGKRKEMHIPSLGKMDEQTRDVAKMLLFTALLSKTTNRY